jgi:outer membrane protein
MIRRWLVLLILAVLTAAGPCLAQEKLTLKQSIDLVLQNSQMIAMAGESVTQAQGKIDESNSLYFPQASLSGSYTRISLVSEFTIPFNGVNQTFRFGTPNNYSLRGSLTEQVFNWGRTAKTVEASQAGFRLAEDGLVLTKQMLSYQVVPFFYGIVFFEEAIKVLDDNLKLFDQKRAIMDQRFKAGLVSSFDINFLEVQVQAVKAQRLDFENSIHKFRLALNALAGRDPEAAFQPAAELAQEPVALTDEALLAEALARRLEFQQIQHQLELGRASLDLARTGDKPTLIAAFNYEVRNGFLPEVDKMRGNWSALLSVSYPVFDGFRVKAQVAEAESGLKAVEMKKTDQERMIALEVRSALADLRTIEQKIDIERLKIRQAEDALRIADERYQNGLLSVTDLIEAQNALEGARLNYLQLVYNHNLGRYNLYRACGRTL